MAGSSSELQQTIRRLAGRVLEFSAWRNRAQLTIPSAKFRADEKSDWIDVRTGELWPVKARPVWFRFDIVVPPSWRGMPVHSHFSLGGEALVSVNGDPLGGLNTFHQEHQVLASAAGDDELSFLAEVVPHGLFGTPTACPRIDEAALLVPDPEVRALHEDLAAALDAANYLQSIGRDDVCGRIVDALQRAVEQLPIPRDQTSAYLARIAAAARHQSADSYYGNEESLASLWEDYVFSAPPSEFSGRSQLSAIRTQFANEVAKVRELYPPTGQVWLTGHAHIDLAWLWPIEETQRKIRRTFHTIVGLMDRYPEFYFNQSSAQAYAWAEQNDPNLFAKIQAKVSEGHWEIIGGMWVEPDGNLPGGESWVRQLLFGQRFFSSRFNRRPRVAWIPDSFGFTGNLPQLLRSAGITYFFTHKLTWNERNEFPADLYWWEGIDGSRVLAHSFRNPVHGYNARIEAFDLGETWRHFRGKRYHDSTLLAFGYGDGGGGPTTEMLERFNRLKNFPAMPNLVMGKVEEFYERVSSALQSSIVATGTESLPVWVGEQYLEFHRATYTTQAKVKALHRQLEQAIGQAEIAAVLAHLSGAKAYPTDDLRATWETLLLNEFHDILPGSSIHSVYDTAHAQLEAAVKAAESLCQVSLDALSSDKASGVTLAVWNLQLHSRPLMVELTKPDGVDLLTSDSTQVFCQEIASGKILAVAPNISVPPLGSVYLTWRKGENAEPAFALQASSQEMENEHLRVVVKPDGSLGSVYDRDHQREVLADRGNQLWIHTDIPRQFDAWDVDATYVREGLEVLATEPPQLVKSGPVYTIIRVVHTFQSSTITQDYSLVRGSRLLAIKTRVQWQGRRHLLRTLFPLRIRSHEFWAETAFGAVARPTHQNTPWDQAKFEVPGHRWIDLSEPGYGVSLLTGSKYGYSCNGNVLGISLLRSPIYPDPYADEGEHEFSYALFPHPGDWRNGTVRAAQQFNVPLQVTHGESKLSWRLSGGTLELACLKKAEDSDDVVLRLYEPHGNRGAAKLSLTGRRVEAAFLTSILEENETPIPLEDGTGLRIEFGPFQVITVKLRFGAG
jgi:alpha-mannosidase